MLNWKVFAILFVFYGFYLVTRFAEAELDGIIEMTFILACFLAVLPTLREERFKGEVVFCSLPTTRRRIVIAKYLGSWVMVATAFVFTFFVVIFSSFVFQNVLGSAAFNMTEERTINGITVVTVFIIVATPLLLRFGTYKGVLITLISLQFLGFAAWLVEPVRTVVSSAISIMLSVGALSQKLTEIIGKPQFFLLAVALVFAVNYLSYKCATALYGTKEL
jgi:hypothetical protein